MSFSATVTEQAIVGGVVTTKQQTITSGGLYQISETVPASTTNQLIAANLDVSQAAFVYIVADYDCTLKTNSTSSPNVTMNLKAGVPYLWYTNKYNALLFTADITAIYLTTGANDTTLTATFLADPTV